MDPDRFGACLMGLQAEAPRVAPEQGQSGAGGIEQGALFALPSGHGALVCITDRGMK